MSKNSLLLAAFSLSALFPFAELKAERSSPQGGQSNQPIVTLVPAGRMKELYLVDVYVQGVADLRSYQVTVKTTGGRSGKLDLAGVVVNRGRTDYVFGESDAITAESVLSAKLGAVAYNEGVAVTAWKYLGTYLFRPSSDATGEFRVSIVRNSDSLLANTNHDEIEFATGADAIVSVRSRTGGQHSVKGPSKE